MSSFVSTVVAAWYQLTSRTARRIECPVTFTRDEVRAMTGGWAPD